MLPPPLWFAFRSYLLKPLPSLHAKTFWQVTTREKEYHRYKFGFDFFKINSYINDVATLNLHIKGEDVEVYLKNSAYKNNIIRRKIDKDDVWRVTWHTIMKIMCKCDMTVHDHQAYHQLIIIIQLYRLTCLV